jgi:hypothetical protein
VAQLFGGLFKNGGRQRSVVVVAGAIAVAILVLVIVLANRDPAAAPFAEASILESKDALAAALARYENVCTVALDSKLCPQARSRATELRLKLGETAIESMKFAEAEALLKVVEESGDDESKKKAHELISTEIWAGHNYEKSLASSDKRAALAGMEGVAGSRARVAALATEWINKERPALLLDDAVAACTSERGPTCPAACDRLLSLHPGTPEAMKAGDLKAAFQAREEARLYQVYLQAEKLMSECFVLWKESDQKHKCQTRVLYATEGNVWDTMAVCGDFDDINKKEEKLKASWETLIAGVPKPESLAVRWTNACEKGEYVAQTPKKPASPEKAERKGDAVPNAAQIAAPKKIYVPDF